MTTPGVSSSGRGQPAFDPVAAEVIGAVRGQPRRYTPPEGYERAELSPEEQAEAAKAAADEARICRYCVGYHKFPTSIGCPRIAEADLNGDGTPTRVRFFEGRAWAKGRVVFYEDTQEEPDGDD